MVSCSLLVFYTENNFYSVKKIHKNCCKQRAALFGSEINKIVRRLGFTPDPTGGAYSAPPGLLAVFMGPTSKGMKGGEGERRKEGRGRESKSTCRDDGPQSLNTPLNRPS